MIPYRGLLVVLAVCCIGVATGCGSDASEESSPASEQLIDKIGKKIDFAAYSGEMRQLAILYVTFETSFNRPPKTVKEFKDYIQRDAAQLVKWMDEGYYVVLPNVKPNSSSILVYQNKDLRGKTRIVAKGDGTIHEMAEAAFQVQLKNQQK